MSQIIENDGSNSVLIGLYDGVCCMLHKMERIRKINIHRSSRNATNNPVSESEANAIIVGDVNIKTTSKNLDTNKKGILRVLLKHYILHVVSTGIVTCTLSGKLVLSDAHGMDILRQTQV